MSYPPPPASPYPAPSGGPVRLRGRTPRRLGWIFLVVGIVLIVVGGVVAAKKSFNKVDSFQRVAITDGTGVSTGKVTLKAGKYLAYFEQRGIDNKTKDIPIPAIRLTPPSGAPMVLDTLYGGGARESARIKSYLTYSYHGHDGVAIYQFTLTQSGQYTVELAVAGSGAQAGASDVAFGPSIAKGTAVAAALIVPGVLLVIAAIVLLIVGFVKRGRHKRELASAGAGYGGYPPPGQGYGGPGYGGPGQPQQGQPQQGFPPPGQGYQPPQQGYGSSQGYQPPQQGYEPPSQ